MVRILLMLLLLATNVMVVLGFVFAAEGLR
jgi:hypothetical protein